MWTSTQIVALTRNHKLRLAVSSLLSATAGGSAVYVVMRKKLEEKYAQIAHEEIRQGREFYARMAPKEIVVEVTEPSEIDPEDVKEAVALLSRYQGVDPMDADTNGLGDDPLVEKIRAATDEADPMPPGLTRNIFEHPTPPGEEVLGALMADRGPDRPYLITKDEFFENEWEFPEHQLTWYEGDSVLADESDVPVPDIARVVGEDNILRFGYGSGDETIVYVCNERMKLVIEISKSTGKFAHEVAGFNGGHLEHSDRRVRKTRRYDE